MGMAPPGGSGAPRQLQRGCQLALLTLAVYVIFATQLSTRAVPPRDAHVREHANDSPHKPRSLQRDLLSVVIPLRFAALPADIAGDLRALSLSKAPSEPLHQIILVVPNASIAEAVRVGIFGGKVAEGNAPRRVTVEVAGTGSLRRDRPVSVASLLQEGVRLVSAEYCLIVFPTHYPPGGLRQLALNLRRYRNGTRTGLVSCSVESDGGHIDEYGYQLVYGRSSWGDPAPFIAKALSGFFSKDARTRGPAAADFVSPFCLFGSTAFLLSSGAPVFAAEPSREDLALAGMKPAGPRLKEVGVAFYLAERETDFLRKLISGFSAAELLESGQTQELLTRSFDLMQRITNITKAHHGEYPVGRELQLVVESALNNRSTLLAQLSKRDQLEVMLLEGRAIFKRLSSLDGQLQRTQFEPEESIGWELSLLARRNSLPVVVAPVRTKIRSDLLPASVVSGKAAFVVRQRSRVAQLDPSVFTATRSGRVNDTVPPLKVVWDTYCCHCCGFTNEIVHLVVPLQELYDVDLTAGPECFCPGFPQSVADTIQRLYTPKERYEAEFNNKEFTVWISHRDPGAYHWAKRDYHRQPDYVVGRSMYEMTKLPDYWVEAANKDADEIWVPAEWVRRTFVANGIKESLLVTIPEAIDTNFFDPSIHTKFALPAGAQQRGIHQWCNHPLTDQQASNYKFFSNFKWEPRKGWDTLLEAYFNEFQPTDRVSLYILTHIWFSRPELQGDKHNVTFLKEVISDFARTRMGVTNLSGLPHFCLLAKDLDETEVAEVYASVDAFVLPTRGEGWGLPTMQAMSMALPTISTNWGGQMEFMTPEVSFLIEIDGLEELPRDSVYGWEPGKKWAIPSLLDTRQHMRAVFQDPAYGRRVGEAARRTIVERFSESALLAIMHERLEAIRRKLFRSVTLSSTPPPHRRQLQPADFEGMQMDLIRKALANE